PTLPPPPTPMPLPSAPRLTVPRQGSFIFYEDFEKGLDRWNLSGGSGGVGWTRLNAFTCGGAWTMLLGTPEWTPYREVVGEAFLTTKAPIDLAKANRPHLFFDVRGEAEPAEALATQAEVSPDGKVWQPIGEPTTARHRFVSTLFADLTPFRGSGLYLRFRARLQVRTAPTKGLLLDDIHLIEPDLSAPVR
ncbi:MAG: hypothetical protein VKP62_06015, partial [Candidatus Sericytochromatia bacterium]|nr:hypothetical protein [Candidatus Sericytochromatia bacterium]